MPTTAIACKCTACGHEFEAKLSLPMAVGEFSAWCKSVRCDCGAEAGAIVIPSRHEEPATPAERPQARDRGSEGLSKPGAPKSRPMSEAAITAQIMAMLKRVPRSFVLKTHGGPMQQAGLPDILFWCGSVSAAFEVKVPGNRATPLQAHTISRMCGAGVSASVVNSVEQVRDVLAALGIRLPS